MFSSCQFRTVQVAVEVGAEAVVVAVPVAVAKLPERRMSNTNHVNQSFT